MANIGQFNVGTAWTKIETVTNFSYVVGRSYLIQNKGLPSLMLCEYPTQPTGAEVGFVVNTDDKILYTCKEGEFLWIRAYANTASFNIAEGV